LARQQASAVDLQVWKQAQSVVLRRTLLAVFLCLSAWAIADRTVTDMPGAHVLSAPTEGTALSLSKPPADSHSSDLRWEAPEPYAAFVRGASSLSHLQHVELPGVSGRTLYRIVYRSDASTSPARLRPPHLFDTPLLI
jgi:hypothetical protein